MKTNLTTLALGALLFTGITQVNALEETFGLTGNTTGGNLSGATYTLTLEDLVEGAVTFDATITVTGSNTLTQTATTGLGVSGNDSDLVDEGESLLFSVAITNQTGGTVQFDGFTEIDFSSFDGSDEGSLSLDGLLATTGDNFFNTTTGANIVDISTTSPISFFAISAIGVAGADNTFRVTDVTGKFSVVPEPGIYALIAGMLGLTSVMVRRRK